MKFDNHLLRLYAVTDRSWQNGQTLCEQVEASLQGGVTCVQLREKHPNAQTLLREALQIKELCRRYGALFIINDDVGLALNCGADGVHIGQHDMDARQARRLIGEAMLLGVSASTKEQAIAAADAGADYLGVGAVFPTATKDDADYVDINTLRDICASSQIPVVAIGGISGENMHRLSGLGLAGVALVSAIFSHPDITQRCAALRAQAEELL